MISCGTLEPVALPFQVIKRLAGLRPPPSFFIACFFNKKGFHPKGIFSMRINLISLELGKGIVSWMNSGVELVIVSSKVRDVFDNLSKRRKAGRLRGAMKQVKC
jgi:hypothetical protein